MTIATLIDRGLTRSRKSLRELAALLFRPWLRFLGPAFAVSIGYIDPGNWATDLAAGAYKYRLLWVVVLSNIIALILQVAVSQIATQTGSNLAALFADRWPRLKRAFWLTFQSAAIATDVAEFSGIVLGLQLLFGYGAVTSIALGIGVLTVIFAINDRVSKFIEYMLMAVVAWISFAFGYQIFCLKPNWSAVVHGMVTPVLPDSGALFIAVGIIGATVMPHNLFLHTSLIERNCRGLSSADRQLKSHFFNRETFVALNIAACVNLSILIVGASLLGAQGSIPAVFAALKSIGGPLAALFGAGLLITGIAASVTATAAGDYMFAAFSPIAVKPVIRRGLTLIPTALILVSGVSLTSVLIWSQVALAMILPIALVPLVLLLLRPNTQPKSSPTITYARSLQLVTVCAAVACMGFDAVMLEQLFRP